MQRKVLIIDDNEKFLIGFKALLETFYNEFIETLYIANNAKTGYKIVLEKLVDIIFMDYEMPGIKGDEITRNLSRNDRFIYIVALSFHDDENTVRKMLESGARDYLKKDKISPITLEKYFNKNNKNTN